VILGSAALQLHREEVEMKWLAKAALQKALGWCPGREKLNYFFQHRRKTIAGGAKVQWRWLRK
jgi:hypothetical protein